MATSIQLPNGPQCLCPHLLRHGGADVLAVALVDGEHVVEEARELSRV